MTKPLALASSADQAARFCLACAPVSLAVDRTAGTLAGLQLLAADRPAKGHGFYIDGKTLSTALDVIKLRGGQLKAYVTHDHSGPGTWYWEQDGSELDVAGFFSGISVEKGQLVAGRCEFYPSFRADQKARYDRIMDMAEKTPGLLALSVEVWGYAVYVAKDGVEYSQRPEDVELAYEGTPALRVTEIFAGAFVSDGAATDGLFARLGRKRGGGLLAKLAALLGGDDGEGEPAAPGRSPANSPAPGEGAAPLAPNAQHAAPIVKHPFPPTAPTAPTAMKIIQEIKARFGATPDRQAKAMTILGLAADPAALTIGDVATQVVEAELSAATAQVTALNAKVTQLEADKTALAADKAKLEKQVETLKNAGHAGGVNLGAGGGSGGAAAGDVNPWAAGSINYALQAQILKNDPARAQALQVAAGGKPAAPEAGK